MTDLDKISSKKCLLGDHVPRFEYHPILHQQVGDHVPRLEFHPILHQQDRVLEPHGLGGDCCPAVPL